MARTASTMLPLGTPAPGFRLPDTKLFSLEDFKRAPAVVVVFKPGIGCNIKWKPGNEPDYYGA